MKLNIGPSQSHIGVIRKFGLKPRKPHIRISEPKMAKIKINPMPFKPPKII